MSTILAIVMFMPLVVVALVMAIVFSCTDEEDDE